MTAPKIEMLNPADLVAYARNSRTHSTYQVKQIADSIREFGFTNPVLIADDETVIAGHGRVLAALDLGLGAVPCIRLSHLSETQRRAYVIADNKLALNSGWDFDLLVDELKALELADYSLEVIGFDIKELESLYKNETSNATPPEQFPEHDENIKTDHACPKCGYEWSGKQI